MKRAKQPDNIWGARLVTPRMWRECWQCELEIRREPMVELYQRGIASLFSAFSLFTCVGCIGAVRDKSMRAQANKVIRSAVSIVILTNVPLVRVVGVRKVY